MYRKAKILIGIMLVILLVPFTAYSQDLNSDLLRAAEQGNTASVKALMSQGADVNAKSKDGWTALMFAATMGHTEIVKTLLAKGADVNAKSKDGWTALVCAAVEGHTKTVEMLLAKGADVNAKNKHGYTALMGASLKGHLEIVKALLDKGASVAVIEKDGHTALTLAALGGHIRIVQVLRDKGVVYKSPRIIPEDELGENWKRLIRQSDSIESLKTSPKKIFLQLTGGLFKMTGQEEELLMPFNPGGPVVVPPMADGTIYTIIGQGSFFGLEFKITGHIQFAIYRGIGLVHLGGKGVVKKTDGTKLFDNLSLPGEKGTQPF